MRNTFDTRRKYVPSSRAVTCSNPPSHARLQYPAFSPSIDVHLKAAYMLFLRDPASRHPSTQRRGA